MKKKIILTIFATVIFFMPFQNALLPNHTEAFVSKLMGLSAKKMAKEVAKDFAVESAANYALNEAFKIADAQMAKYNQEEAYKIVCLYQTTGEVCDKPIAIKENLTEADKISIAHQAEIELDKLVSPEGKGFTKWQKFMDWFGPVWITSAIMTVITYAIDSDVRSLFNEAGYNALVALGLIKPINEKDVSAFETVQVPPVQPNTENPNYFTKTNTTIDRLNSINFSGKKYQNKDIIMKTELTGNHPTLNSYSLKYTMNNDMNIMEYLELDFVARTIKFGQDVIGNSPSTTTLTMQLNGTTLTTLTNGSNANSGWISFTLPTVGSTDINAEVRKSKSVQTRTAYELNGFFYTDVLFKTVDGNTLKFQLKTPSAIYPEINGGTSAFYYSATPTEQISQVFTMHFNQSPTKTILPPVYDSETEQIPKSNYEDDKGNIALVPPSAIPMTQPSTGQKVTIQPNPVPGGEPILTNENGDPVPDDDVELGDPVITPSPEGIPTVTPQPSPSNPSPQPQPLTPTPTPTPTPPLETEPPKFPEGESCSEGLKLPKIKPLTQSITTAFPFSIPFDLYKGFQALFSEIGTEKPSFNLVIGDSIDWEITIPDYFDSWKTFSDGILIFVFDVGLIYAIYRFMSGGGS